MRSYSELKNALARAETALWETEQARENLFNDLKSERKILRNLSAALSACERENEFLKKEISKLQNIIDGKAKNER